MYFNLNVHAFLKCSTEFDIGIKLIYLVALKFTLKPIDEISISINLTPKVSY